MYKLKKVRSVKIKQFPYKYYAWKKAKTVEVLKRRGYKKRPDWVRSAVSIKEYHTAKQVYYTNQLSILQLARYSEFTLQEKKVRKAVILREVNKLKALKDKKGNRAYTDMAIKEIIKNKTALGIINETEKTLFKTAKDIGYYKVSKGMVYDKINKKTYTERGFNVKIQLHKYWNKVHAISDSLGLSVAVVRNDLKRFGSEFYEGLYYMEGDISPILANPEELREYWKDVKDLSKKEKWSIKKTRAFIKKHPVNYINRLK